MDFWMMADKSAGVTKFLAQRLLSLGLKGKLEKWLENKVFFFTD